MKIHLPNSAFLGNIDPFFRGFDPADPGRLEITANEKWISVHPVVLSMIAALGVSMKPEIRCEKLEAKSRHYLVRMGLFRILNRGFIGYRVSDNFFRRRQTQCSINIKRIFQIQIFSF